MLDSRVRIGAESISGSGAKSDAEILVLGKPARRSNIFADRLAAKAKPLVRSFYSYNYTITGTHENGADLEIPITRAGAQREESRGSVAHSANESSHKWTAKDSNVDPKI